MKTYLVFVLFLLVTTQVLAKQAPLFTIEGKTRDKAWSVVSKFYSQEKPKIEKYRECLRQYCHGDWYEGNYSCEECTEYSEWKERVDWTISIETSFYHNNVLQHKSVYSSWFLEKKVDQESYLFYATSKTLYSQSCPDNSHCFKFFAGFTSPVGYLDQDLNPHIKIFGQTLQGRMNLFHNNQTIILPVTFEISR